jgi:hypothetical protein
MDELEKLAGKENTKINILFSIPPKTMSPLSPTSPPDTK